MMNAIKITLSEEVLSRGKQLAAAHNIPVTCLLSFLLEGWTNPQFRLRRVVVANNFTQKVGLTSKTSAKKGKRHER